jgi:hypothetical protein
MVRVTVLELYAEIITGMVAETESAYIIRFELLKESK